jgi:hypothetical protein
MFNIQQHLRHVVLALGLAAASLTAGATVLPTYHIGLADPASLGVTHIDFVFSSNIAAAAGTASLSHFAGNSLSDFEPTGGVNPTPGGFVFDNASSYNELYLAVDGPFAFDLNFSEGFLGFVSDFDSLFSIYLLDASDNPIIDANAALTFTLSTKGVVIDPGTSQLSLTEVAAVAVPEPADWALMLTGLVFLAYSTRFNGRTKARRLAAA